MSESKPVYWTPDPATILKLYTEMEKGDCGYIREIGF